MGAKDSDLVDMVNCRCKVGNYFSAKKPRIKKIRYRNTHVATHQLA